MEHFELAQQSWVLKDHFLSSGVKENTEQKLLLKKKMERQWKVFRRSKEMKSSKSEKYKSHGQGILHQRRPHDEWNLWVGKLFAKFFS